MHKPIGRLANEKKSYTIAVLPGDGIGSEISAQAVRILQTMAARHHFTVELRYGLIGEAAIEDGERPLPPATLRICRDADAVLMGPVGGSNWDDALSTAHPKQAVIKLRAWLNSFATVRRLRAADGMDVAVVYDNSSGLFYGSPRGIVETDHGRVATNTEVYSDAEAIRTLELAFAVSRLRDKRVHVVDQAKYLETGQIWRDAALRLAAQHPDVHMTRQDASHFFYDFMIDSSRYDVIVSEMGLGHLISSMAAGHTGSLAIHAAAYLGGDVPLFQPSHGSNPEEAGRGVANPLGMIRAVSLMLRLAMGQRAACTELDEAIERVVVTHLTHAGPADDTVSLADAVLAALPSAALHPPAR